MTCVIVLGVPRSGTSALAGFLHTQLRVQMGDDLMPAMAGINDRGFFEDMEFVQAHIELLGSHEDPRTPEHGVLTCPQNVLDGYTELIHQRERAHPLWGVKDPKLCFLLPYFLRRLTTPYKILVCRRSFVSSVESMLPLYGGMNLDQAILRVGRYLHALEQRVEGLKRDAPDDFMFVDYEVLLRSPEGYIHDIMDLLGMDAVALAPKDIRVMARWFEPSLSRHGPASRVATP